MNRAAFIADYREVREPVQGGRLGFIDGHLSRTRCVRRLHRSLEMLKDQKDHEPAEEAHEPPALSRAPVQRRGQSVANLAPASILPYVRCVSGGKSMSNTAIAARPVRRACFSMRWSRWWGTLGPSYEARRSISPRKDAASRRVPSEVGQPSCVADAGGEPDRHPRPVSAVARGPRRQFGIRFTNLDSASTVALQRVLGMVEDAVIDPAGASMVTGPQRCASCRRSRGADARAHQDVNDT